MYQLSPNLLPKLLEKTYTDSKSESVFIFLICTGADKAASQAILLI